MDSSALLKRYYREVGSDKITKLLSQESVTGTAVLSYAEFYSGLTRKLREGTIDPADYRAAAGAFDKDWPLLYRIPLSFDVLKRARTLMEAHALRAGDAIQLASAHIMGSPGSVGFVSADRALIRAAVAEGFSIL